MTSNVLFQEFRRFARDMTSRTFPVTAEELSAAFEDSLQQVAPALEMLRNGCCQQEQQMRRALHQLVQDTIARPEEMIYETLHCPTSEAKENMHQQEEASVRKEMINGEAIIEMDIISAPIATKEESRKSKRMELTPGSGSKYGAFKRLKGCVVTEETVEKVPEDKNEQLEALGHLEKSVCPQASSSSNCSPPSAPKEPSPCASESSVSAPSPPGSPALRKTMGKILRRAAGRGNLQQVRELLENGADVNAATSVGITPLMEATIYRRPSVISLLLQHDAKVDNATLLGHTALHYAAIHDRRGQCLRLLVDAGSALDIGDHSGRTPLHEAASRTNEKAVRVLLEAGASKTVEDNYGDQPYHACHYSKAIRRLLRC